MLSRAQEKLAEPSKQVKTKR